jgi:hypothetical protein
MTGLEEATRIREAWRDWIVHELREWLPADAVHAAKVDAAVERIVARVIREVQGERAERAGAR